MKVGVHDPQQAASTRNTWSGRAPVSQGRRYNRSSRAATSQPEPPVGEIRKIDSGRFSSACPPEWALFRPMGEI